MVEGEGEHPWKTLPQNVMCSSEHENCPAGGVLIFCLPCTQQNESTAGGAFPLIAVNLLGMEELFLHSLARPKQSRTLKGEHSLASLLKRVAPHIRKGRSVPKRL